MSILTYIMLGLLALLALILLYLIVLFVRNPVLVKIGLRNIPRRPLQSILIVVGLTLSTVIVVSSLAVGDTLNYSVQRQAVDAYGAIDEILAPPIVSLLVSLAGEEDSAAADEVQAQFDQLTEGGLSTVLSIIGGGLPSISEERFRQLKSQAEEEPLIDGVAGSIIFPTIIRDVSSGQGEPFGFIFAVDDDYDEQFGLTDVAGTPLEMEVLAPGVGNIFGQAANLFDMAGDLAGRMGLDNFSVSQVAAVTAAVGAVATGAVEGEFDPTAVEIDLQTLRDLGIDTTALEEAGVETLSLETLGITDEVLEARGITTPTLTVESGLNAVGVDPSALQDVGSDLLGALNLNTLGGEIDRVLAQVGLQLRQGDIYLNRLGAERLNARVGDVVEIYIGPVPVPFRVRGIVEQAGPMAALAPVAMMRLSEAQQLLFMRDRVNSILVSNLGDEMEGIQHTAAVSKRLRSLAMDEPTLEEVVALLRRPEVRSVIDAAAGQATLAGMDEFEGPAFMANFFENLVNIADFETLARGLPEELDQEGISDQLRLALSNNAIREWLLDLDLPDDVRGELREGLASLNQFDLLDPLNKSTVVTVAGVGGTVFTSIFSLFGFFSVLAAILLIFLIFVMLAAERRSEMGMARAIGVQRTHLVQMFVTEGLIYDLVAAAIGVLLGVGVSYAMIGFIGGLFNDIAGQFSEYGGVFRFQFRASTQLLIIAYAVGVIFTFVVVSIAAWRVSRLNIVAAIRDLPEEENRGGRSRLGRAGRMLFGPLLLVAGGAVTYYGINGRFSLALVGASLLLVGLSFTAGRLLERTTLRSSTIQRLVYTAIGLGLLVIWGVPWANWFPDAALGGFQDGPWTLVRLALTGPLLILGAILVVMFNADTLTWLVTRLLGGVGVLTPVLKTAIAYPLSSRFRTGMTMLLFAMVISTVTIMTVVIQATQTLVAPDSERNAGFEISTSFSILSFLNPLTDLEAAMAANPAFPAADVAEVGAVAEQFAQAQRGASADPDGEWRFIQMAGLNDGYLRQAEATYSFALRAPGFADDAAVWEALRTRDDVAVVTRQFVFATAAQQADAQAQGGPTPPPFMSDPEDQADFDQEFRGSRRLFDDFSLEDAALPELTLMVRPVTEFGPGGETVAQADAQPVQIIGVIAQGTTLAPEGLQMGRATFSRVTGAPMEPGSYYIKVREGADVRTVAQEVESAFLSSGLNASIMAEQFAQGQALTRGILRLFQGFMALGLLVGIAALGVVSSRSVVERRQQIGMLRAIGFQPRMIALSFILEASFVAVTGLLIGVIGGVALGDVLVGQSFEALADGRNFTTPWGQIALIVAGAYLFALLTTLIPAFQATRVYPAEALRYE